MRNFLRFIFSDTDQARIDEASIQADDVDIPASQSLRLSFRIKDPANGPIKMLPLFPGQIQFLCNAASIANLPLPANVDLTAEGYERLKQAGVIRGTIAVVLQPKESTELATLNLVDEVLPNRAWFSTAILSREFLFGTLVGADGLDRREVPNGAAKIGPANAAWPKHAVSGFLKGTYQPVLKLRGNESADDVARLVMPAVDMQDDGTVELTITFACAREPQDDNDSKFNALAVGVSPLDPIHPRNGHVPARHIYRILKDHIIGTTPGNPVSDRVTADWPQQPRYFKIQFTRTWKRIANCSVHFPKQTINIMRNGGERLLTKALPAHGVIYLPQLPAVPIPEPPNISIEIAGGMRSLKGSATAWRDKGKTDILDFNLVITPSPHVILRSTMSEEMMIEEFVQVPGDACTFLSMRRSIRALINNRIAGGRLNHEKRTQSATLKLINDAWNDRDVLANIVANNCPVPSMNPSRGASNIAKALNKLFPDDVPAQVIDGSANRAQVYKKGEMAYHIWQSNFVKFQHEDTKRNFSDAFLGRGGPGALVVLGLSDGLLLDPVKLGTDADDNAYFSRVALALMNGLQPGAIIQFWNHSDDFDDLKHRRATAAQFVADGHYGHSPVFNKYILNGANRIGFHIIDQYGNMVDGITHVLDSGKCLLVSNNHLSWQPHDDIIAGTISDEFEQIWIAANWNE